MKISEYGVRHPAVVGMLLIVLVVFGIVSVVSMNIEFMADVSAPSVIVISVYPGASPEDIEQDVTSVLEDDFVTLPDFKSVSSQSSNSVSVVTITFQDGVDPHDRITEVRDRINKLTEELPDGLSGVPNVIVGGVEMLPIFSFSVEGGNDGGTVTAYIKDTLLPRLTSIEGVSSVEISGGKELRVNVMLRLDDLAAKGVSAMSVYQILEYSNVSLPAGNAIYNDREITVNYSGQFMSLQDIKELPVGSTDQGVIIRLQDVADVTLSYPELETYVTNGKENIILVDIMKRSDGNSVKIAKQAKQVLEESKKQTGGAFSYSIVNDDSRTIFASLKTVILSGLTGIFMAVIVIFLFLGDAKATIIIGISIPLSILFTFCAMKVSGITINLMSLSGMVVALGMVVDGSIVMIEQVYRYYKMKNSVGQPLYSVEQSIFTGSGEVSSSIFASTATTVVVFIPIAMLPGIVGMIVKDVALTLIMALVASLISALIVVPFLMGLLLRQSETNIQKETFVAGGMVRLEKKYKKMLKWALNSWSFVLFLALAILIASVFVATALGVSFIPSTDNSDFYIDVEFPAGYTLEQTNQGMQMISSILEENVPEVQSVVFFAGSSQDFGSSGNTANSGYGHVVLIPVAERSRNIHDIILLMQSLVSSNVPDVSVKVTNGGYDKLLGYVSGGGGYGITLVGEDLDTLYGAASDVLDFLRLDSEVVSAEMDTSFDSETLTIDMVHDYMSSLGVSSYEAGVTATILFQGMDTGRYRDNSTGQRYDIRLYSDVTGKPISKDIFSNISVVSATGVPVSFANISSLQVQKSLSQINHQNRTKTITVSATLVSEDTAGVTNRVNQWIQENPLPQGITTQAGGIGELIGDSLPSLLGALAIAWFLVYTVMVLQFERFRQPFIIMATIPFCLIGVVLGLLLFGSTMSLLALMGIISLGGVVVNNGIILVDYINLLRNEKKQKKEETEADLVDCIVSGAASRLRPIFMTTLTTMLGVVPMAVAKGEGAEIYAPLGQAIAGGLLTSTLITLFVVPVLYFISERRGFTKKKNVKHKTTLLAIFLLSLCIVGFAQEQEPNLLLQEKIEKVSLPVWEKSSVYTFDMLSSLMEENNAILIKAQEDYAQALIDLKDAKAGYQPTVQLSLGGSYMVNPTIGKIQANAGMLGEIPIKNPATGSSVTLPLPTEDLVIFEGMPKALYSFQLDLQQPIFTWGKITNSVKIYSMVAEIRHNQLYAQRVQQISQLEATLYSLYYISKMEELLDTQHQYAQRLVELSQEAEKNGVLLKQQVLEAQMQAALIPVTKAELESVKSNLLQTLCRMTGIANLSMEQIDFIPDENQFLSLLNTERTTLMQQVISPERSAIAIVDGLCQVAEYTQKVAENSVYWKPDVALQLTFGLNGDVTKLVQGEFQPSKDLVANFSLGVKTTVWDGGKKLNQITRSESQSLVAVVDKKDTEAALIQELEKQLNAMQMAFLRIQYQNLKLETATSDIQRKEQLVATGYGSQRDVLQAKIESVTAEIELLQQKINLSTAGCTAKSLLQ